MLLARILSKMPLELVLFFDLNHLIRYDILSFSSG